MSYKFPFYRVAHALRPLPDAIDSVVERSLLETVVFEIFDPVSHEGVLQHLYPVVDYVLYD